MALAGYNNLNSNTPNVARSFIKAGNTAPDRNYKNVGIPRASGTPGENSNNIKRYLDGVTRPGYRRGF